MSLSGWFAKTTGAGSLLLPAWGRALAPRRGPRYVEVVPPWPRPRPDVALAILRICAASTMIYAHGWPKLAGWSTKSLTDPFGIGSAPSLALAIGGELVGAAFVLVGFQARWAAIPVAATMAVAAFIQHAADPFGKKELALVYLVCFVVIAVGGAGALSVDAWRAARKADVRP
jgi:putative oxidoreductase